ncbi:UNVERIFIED_CONTAM: hypothetical protein GTU68_056576 [Idotea baltica]|nr:hypothetical protein [Idotea baltica]
MSRKKTTQRRSKKNARTKSSTTYKEHSRKRATPAKRTNSNKPQAQKLESDEPTLVVLLNKPFQVLCQFTDQDDRETLANYINIPNLYAAGRLDRDSEGLLLLTNSGMLQHRIAHPDFKLPKTYLAQLEGDISTKALKQLCEGVKLNDGLTAPAEAMKVDEPDWLWPRNPPIRFRKEVPTSWLQLKITEGRNRQVRRMTAAVGYPTLRLIRTHIGAHSVKGIAPGEHREVDEHLS